MWAVEEARSHKLIGRIGCLQPEGWPGFEIGWTLGRQYWGQGYATEGGRAALDYAFRTLNQQHVISLIQPGNQASIRVAERLGERLEGRGEVMGKEVLIYGISRERWQAA